MHAAHALDKRPDVKAIIITGDGTKAFAAGADIMEMVDQTYDEVSASLLGVRISSSDCRRLQLIKSCRGLKQCVACTEYTAKHAFCAPSAGVSHPAWSHLVTCLSLQPA